MIKDKPKPTITAVAYTMNVDYREGRVKPIRSQVTATATASKELLDMADKITFDNLAFLLPDERILTFIDARIEECSSFRHPTTYAMIDNIKTFTIQAKSVMVI